MISYRIDTCVDKICRWVAFRLPWRIVYHVLIRGWAKATTGEFSNQDVTMVTVDQMIQRW